MKLPGRTKTNLAYHYTTGKYGTNNPMNPSEKFRIKTHPILEIMTAKLLLVSFLLFCANSFGQTDGTPHDQRFDQKGMKMLSKTELTNDQLSQLLAYDYEQYRMDEESVIIKVVNGPHIELFSKHRIESGEHDPAKEDDLHNGPVSDEIPVKHEHIAPADKKIKKLQIRVVDVFGASK